MNGKSMVRMVWLVAALAALQTSPAWAYRTYVVRSAASGVPTHIWTFYNCVGRVHYPFSGTPFAEHGAVAFREVAKTRCGVADLPTREVWYTSIAGFAGVDRLVFPRGHGRSEILAVTVH
jgi:hypothetical protein